jgi:hypothetical protein
LGSRSLDHQLVRAQTAADGREHGRGFKLSSRFLTSYVPTLGRDRRA